MATELIDLVIEEGSFCPRGANPDARIMLFKMAKEAPMADATLDIAKLDPAVQEYIAGLTTRATAAEAERDALKKAAVPPADTPPTTEEVLKNLDPAARELVQKLQAQADAATAQAASAEKIAKEQSDKLRMAELVAVAKADYSRFPATAEVIAPVLKAMEDNTVTAAQREQFAQWMRSVNEQLAKADAFTVRGSDGTTATDSAAAEVTRRAEELRKTNTALSMAAARMEVRKADPALREREESEREATRH